MKKYTVEWWLHKCMSKEDRDKAIKYSLKQWNRDRLTHPNVGNFYDALNLAFDWYGSPEGASYWEDKACNPLWL